MKIKSLILSAAIGFTVVNAAANPAVISSYIKNAEQIVFYGGYKYSIELFDFVLSLDRNNYDALLGKALSHKLLKEDGASDRFLRMAQEINPSAVLPPLGRYLELERERAKNSEKIKREYYAFLDSMRGDDALAIGSVPKETGEVMDSGSATMAVRAATHDERLKALSGREWSIRGGRGKMTSLGGITHVYQDASTAMDGAAFDIDAGLLFRKKQHYFNLNPFAGYYERRSTLSGGIPSGNHGMIGNSIYSSGETGVPNDYFVNSIRPLFQNSFMHDSSAGLDSKNSGTMYGGMYIAGFKPVPLFGIAGAFGYEHIPYSETAGPVNGFITFSKLEWRVGAGIYFPFLFSKTDGLSLTSAFGTYSPRSDYRDIGNNLFFNLPYSMSHGYRAEISRTEDDFDLFYLPPGGPYIKKEFKDSFEATGYTVKTNLHYMLGNSMHEFFIFVESPVDIKYFTQTQLIIKDGLTGFTVLDEISSPREEAGYAHIFRVKTGIRNDFKYAAAGFKYEIDNETYRFKSALPPQFLPMISEQVLPDFHMASRSMQSHRLTGGLNIKPIDHVSFPVEYEHTIIKTEGEFITLFTERRAVRGGLEIKPIPFFALRGGLSYEFASNAYFSEAYTVYNPGTRENPFVNLLGYHFGAGFDLPLFELNAGGAVKNIYSTPLKAGYESDSAYYLFGFVDLSFYM